MMLLRTCVVLLLASSSALAQNYAGEGTLFRDEIPSRPPRHKPVVENPLDYEVYFDPSLPPSAVGAPLVANNIRDQPPKYVPKPFHPRPRKPVKRLEANGPVLYSAHLDHPSVQHQQDLENIPGYPGQDYPLYAHVPETRFSCGDVPVRPGLYADPDTGCQAYHLCGEDGRDGPKGASFLCNNGTVFSQYQLTCDWWYNVDCSQAVREYEVNLDPYKNPLLRVPEEGPRSGPASSSRSRPGPGLRQPGRRDFDRFADF